MLYFEEGFLFDKGVEIFLKLNGEQVGPYQLDDIKGWLEAGHISVDDTAWFEGCSDWIEVGEIPGVDRKKAKTYVKSDLVLPFEAYIGEDPYVFVCYAHKDSPLVFEELKELDNAGFRIWYDEGIGVSSEWPEEIAKAVLGCSVFMVFISPDATASINCRNEINLALDEKKPFLAVHLEESILPPGLRLRMGDLQAIHRYKLSQEHYSKKVQKTLRLFLDDHSQGQEIARSKIVEPVKTLRRKGSSQILKETKPPNRKPFYLLGLICGFILLLGLFLGLQNETPQEDNSNVKILSLGEPWAISRIGLEMLWCPPGKFLMGSPVDEAGRKENEIQHKVTLKKGFYLGKYEVTQKQWDLVMGSSPSFFKGENKPVERISWHDAKSFCAKLTELDRNDDLLPEGWKYDLPTEAEWEYACRAGSTMAFAWSESIDSSKANFNLDINSTREIGSYLSNSWGFFDMHGNVMEWVTDNMGAYSSIPVIDPMGPSKESNKVMRGGSWVHDGIQLRSSARASAFPSVSGVYIGFRLAFKPENLDLTPPEIEVLGGTEIIHEAGLNWQDPWVVAKDARDGNLSALAKTMGVVEVNKTGSYGILYSVADFSGNESNASRTVEVVDTTGPEITLIGKAMPSLAIDSSWVDPGAAAFDLVEGDLSRGVEVSGSVDVSEVGFYDIIYSVSDSSGNESKKKRTVVVVEQGEFNMMMGSLENNRIDRNVTAMESETREQESLIVSSPELLQAVMNWTQVPESVFPSIEKVEIHQDLEIKIIDEEGEQIASNTILKGTEVVAISLEGEVLKISPNRESKMIGSINVDQTNFKLKVAELFEKNKREK